MINKAEQVTAFKKILVIAQIKGISRSIMYPLKKLSLYYEQFDKNIYSQFVYY